MAIELFPRVPRPIRDLPLRRKLLLVTMGTGLSGILVAAIALMYYEQWVSRAQLVSYLTGQADMIAYNSAAALAFGDAGGAENILRALEAEASVGVAAVYDGEGEPFALYTREESDDGWPTQSPATGYRFTEGNLHVTRPVRLDGETLGTVYLRDDLSGLQRHTRNSGIIVSAVLLLAMMVVWAMTRLLGGLVTGPVLRLTSAARRVSGKNDYSLRLDSPGRDELGVLVRAFNSMLAQIQARDLRLKGHQKGLEVEVGARTLRLTEMNSRLLEATHRAEEASRMKSEFLANMSHEIRTPIHGVLGSLDLLRGTQLDASQEEFLDTARVSGEQLLALVSDILDFSKIEAGRLTLDARDFDLRTVVEDVAMLFAPRAREKGLELVCFVSEEVPTWFHGDDMRLRQVLVNLVGNAVKFTEQGEVVLRVAARDAEGRLVFEVVDTGVGIDESLRERLFQPFTQADSSSTRRYGGTGLGLTISRRLVEMMGGDIAVESVPGAGSRFTFTARLVPGRAAAPRREESQLAGVRVLLCDERRTSREVLEHYLRHWRADLTVLERAGDVLDQLRRAQTLQRPYHLLLLGSDANRIGRALREEPYLNGLRLVVLSSYGEETSAEGAAAVLAKPVRRQRLYETLVAVHGGERVESGAARVQRHFRGRVLVAEDNRINRKVALNLLRRYGITVDLARDGREALELVSASAYDLVFMDVHMPEMDGLEATRRIREVEAPRGGRTPVVALTADALQSGRDSALAAGMDDFLVKPLHSGALEACLAQWLEESMATAVPPPGEPLDLAVTGQLAELLGDGFPQLVEEYLEDAPELLRRAARAAADDDARGLQEAAHSLKSSSASIGAEGLSALARELEMMGRRAVLDGAVAMAGQAEAELERVLAALAAYVKTEGERREPGTA